MFIYSNTFTSEWPFIHSITPVLMHLYLWTLKHYKITLTGDGMKASWYFLGFILKGPLKKKREKEKDYAWILLILYKIS